MSCGIQYENERTVKDIKRESRLFSARLIGTSLQLGMTSGSNWNVFYICHTGCCCQMMSIKKLETFGSAVYKVLETDCVTGWLDALYIFQNYYGEECSMRIEVWLNQLPEAALVLVSATGSSIIWTSAKCVHSFKQVCFLLEFFHEIL